MAGMQGVFAELLRGVWLPALPSIHGKQEVKLVGVATAKVWHLANSGLAAAAVTHRSFNVLVAENACGSLSSKPCLHCLQIMPANRANMPCGFIVRTSGDRHGICKNHCHKLHC